MEQPKRLSKLYKIFLQTGKPENLYALMKQLLDSIGCTYDAAKLHAAIEVL